MPDITKCSGTGCPYKEFCYRYTAKASEYQSYFMNPPIEKGVCDNFWGNVEAIKDIEDEIRKSVNNKE